jgi:glutamyl-tRNA synthetase
MAHNSRFFFVEQIDIDPRAAAKHLSAEGRNTLATAREELARLSEWSAPAINLLLNDLAGRLQSGLGKVAQPLRVAVAGSPVSPPIDVTLELLGRTRTLSRIDAALSGGPPGHAD